MQIRLRGFAKSIWWSQTLLLYITSTPLSSFVYSIESHENTVVFQQGTVFVGPK